MRASQSWDKFQNCCEVAQANRWGCFLINGFILILFLAVRSIGKVISGSTSEFASHHHSFLLTPVYCAELGSDKRSACQWSLITFYLQWRKFRSTSCKLSEFSAFLAMLEARLRHALMMLLNSFSLPKPRLQTLFSLPVAITFFFLYSPNYPIVDLSKVG